MAHEKYAGFTPVSITLEEMMAAREQRSEKSRMLTKRYGKTVVCMTMNFIGEYKLLPLSYAAFCCYSRLVKRTNPCVFTEIQHEITGDTAFFVIDADAYETKAICEKLEDFQHIGRLFDIDVFDTNGEKLSRSQKRSCLLCEKPAVECARSRSHGVEAVREKCKHILSRYFANEIIPFAREALEDEVNATPKPGLVDRRNTGANPDMTHKMFIKSAEIISPYFGEMFSLGASTSDITEKTFINEIRLSGLRAEKAMLAVTGGINTHKGAIYSMGLLSAGIGFALAGGGRLTDAVDAAAQIGLKLSYEITDTSTHGIEVCRKYGVTGARGEAIGGFKTVLYAFERIKHYADDHGLDTNTAYPLAICDVMCVMSDTNVLHRAGQEGLSFLHEKAKEISQLRENQRIDEMYELDKELIKRNISPGGCADMLACAIFLIKSEQLFVYNSDIR